MEKILVICAHPDDETLGLGGTIVKHSKNGAKIFVLVFTEGESGADNVPNSRIVKREIEGQKACSILGVQKTKFLNYSDQKLDDYPVLVLAKEIESIIKQWKPQIVYTHYWGDMNQDHKKLFEATLIAVRPTPWSKIDKLICYETPSSTEWGNSTFKPNLFFNIEKELRKKLSALKQYKDEVSKYPHPRSIEAITNRSKYWGSIVGIKYAEAFFSFRELIRK